MGWYQAVQKSVLPVPSQEERGEEVDGNGPDGEGGEGGASRGVSAVCEMPDKN